MQTTTVCCRRRSVPTRVPQLRRPTATVHRRLNATAAVRPRCSRPVTVISATRQMATASPVVLRV